MKSTLFRLSLSLLTLTFTTSVLSAETCDIDLAKKVYGICAACHGQPDTENPPLGPSLKGLFGRESGTLSGFIYSVAMEKAEITWDEDSLNTYLEAPMTVVSGTSMAFAGIRDEHQRKNLICWLANFEQRKQDSTN